MPIVPARTHHSDQALAICELVNLKFSAVRYGSRHRRLVRLREPDGPSTDGGRKARNALVLISDIDPNEPSVMFGWVDSARQEGEIRAYAVVSDIHRRRFGRGFDLSRTEYLRLSEHVRSFLEAQGIRVRESRERKTPEGRRPLLIQRNTGRWWFLAGFGLGFVCALLLLGFS
ncbi:MAG: hypothetical protein ACFB9M_03935 [Myxococcota bacterium]